MTCAAGLIIGNYIYDKMPTKLQYGWGGGQECSAVQTVVGLTAGIVTDKIICNFQDRLQKKREESLSDSPVKA